MDKQTEADGKERTPKSPRKPFKGWESYRRQGSLRHGEISNVLNMTRQSSAEKQSEGEKSPVKPNSPKKSNRNEIAWRKPSKEVSFKLQKMQTNMNIYLGHKPPNMLKFLGDSIEEIPTAQMKEQDQQTKTQDNQVTTMEQQEERDVQLLQINNQVSQEQKSYISLNDFPEMNYKIPEDRNENLAELSGESLSSHNESKGDSISGPPQKLAELQLKNRYSFISGKSDKGTLRNINVRKNFQSPPGKLGSMRISYDMMNHLQNTVPVNVGQFQQTTETSETAPHLLSSHADMSFISDKKKIAFAQGVLASKKKEQAQALRALEIQERRLDEMVSKDSIAEGTLYCVSGEEKMPYSLSQAQRAPVQQVHGGSQGYHIQELKENGHKIKSTKEMKFNLQLNPIQNYYSLEQRSMSNMVKQTTIKLQDEHVQVRVPPKSRAQLHKKRQPLKQKNHKLDIDLEEFNNYSLIGQKPAYTRQSNYQNEYFIQHLSKPFKQQNFNHRQTNQIKEDDILGWQQKRQSGERQSGEYETSFAKNNSPISKYELQNSDRTYAGSIAQHSMKHNQSLYKQTLIGGENSPSIIMDEEFMSNNKVKAIRIQTKSTIRDKIPIQEPTQVKPKLAIVNILPIEEKKSIKESKKKSHVVSQKSFKKQNQSPKRQEINVDMPGTPNGPKESMNNDDEDSPQHVIIITQENYQNSPKETETLRRKRKNASPNRMNTTRRVDTPTMSGVDLTQPPSYNAVIMTGNQNMETFNLKIDKIRVGDNGIFTQRSFADGTTTNIMSNRNSQDPVQNDSASSNIRATIMSDQNPINILDTAASNTFGSNTYRNIKTSEPKKRSKKQDQNQIQRFLNERRTTKSMKGSRIKIPNKYTNKSLKQSIPTSRGQTARHSIQQGDQKANMYKSLKTARDTIQDQERINPNTDSLINAKDVDQITSVVTNQANYLLGGGGADPINIQVPSQKNYRGDQSSPLNSTKVKSSKSGQRNTTLIGNQFMHPPEIKILSSPLSVNNAGGRSNERNRFQHIQYGFQQLNQIEKVTSNRGSKCSKSLRKSQREDWARMVTSGTHLTSNNPKSAKTGYVLSTGNSVSPQSQRNVFSARGQNAAAQNRVIQYQNLTRKTTHAQIGAKPKTQNASRQQTLSHENIHLQNKPFQQVDDLQQQLYYLQMQEQEIYQNQHKNQISRNQVNGGHTNPINIIEIESNLQNNKRTGTRMIDQVSSQQHTQMKSQGPGSPPENRTPNIQPLNMNLQLKDYPQSHFRVTGQTPDKLTLQVEKEGLKTHQSSNHISQQINEFKLIKSDFSNNQENKKPQFADTGCQMSSSSEEPSEGSPSQCKEDKAGVFSGKSQVRTSKEIKNSLIGVRYSQNSQFIDNSVVSLNIDQILLPEMPNDSQNDTYRQSFSPGYEENQKLRDRKKQFGITLDSEHFMKCTPGPTVPIQFTTRRPQDFNTTRGVVRTKYASNKRAQFNTLLCHGFNIEKTNPKKGVQSAKSGNKRVIKSGFSTQRRRIQDPIRVHQNPALSGQKINLSLTANATYIKNAQMAIQKQQYLPPANNIIQKLQIKRDVNLKDLGDFEKSLIVKKELINAEIKRMELKHDAATTPLSQGGTQMSGGAKFNSNERKRIYFNQKLGLVPNNQNPYSDIGQTEQIDKESCHSNSDIKQFTNQNTTKARYQQTHQADQIRKKISSLQCQAQFSPPGSSNVSKNYKEQANFDLLNLNIAKSTNSNNSRDLDMQEMDQSKSSIQDKSVILQQIYPYSPASNRRQSQEPDSEMPSPKYEHDQSASLNKPKFPSTRNSMERRGEITSIKQIIPSNSRDQLNGLNTCNNTNQQFSFDQNVQQFNLLDPGLLASDRQGQVMGAGEYSLAPESEFQMKDPLRIISGATENSQESPIDQIGRVIEIKTFGSIHDVEPELQVQKVPTGYEKMSQKKKEKNIQLIYGIQKKPSHMSPINQALYQEANTPQLGCYAQKGTDTSAQGQLSSALLCNKNV